MVKDRQAGRLEAPVEIWGKEFPGSLPGIPATRGLLPSIITEHLARLLKLLHNAGVVAKQLSTYKPWIH